MAGPYRAISTAEKRAELEAKGEPWPEGMEWKRNPKYRAGGYWASIEKQRESRRRWSEAYPEKQRESRSRWNAANPEKRREGLEKLRRWNAANPEKGRERSRRWKRTDAGMRSLIMSQSRRRMAHSDAACEARGLD